MATAIQQRGKAAGFSLIEILIAIGILGVCLPMAAALFATAIKENEGSYENSMGSLICDNGLAIIKTKLKASDIPSTPVAPPFFTPLSVGATYSMYASTKDKGFLAMGLQITPNDNDYGIIVISYTKKGDDTDIVTLQHISTAKIDAYVGSTTSYKGYSTLSVDPADQKYLQVGSPVVLDYVAGNQPGLTATIIRIEGTTAVLDHKFVEGTGTGHVWVVYEGTPDLPNPPKPIGLESPALSIISVRTSL